MSLDATIRHVNYGIPVDRSRPPVGHRCPWQHTEPCESCGQPVAVETWDDDRPAWSDLLFHTHQGPHCDRSGWAEHTPRRCRQFRDGREWVSVDSRDVLKTRRNSPTGEWASGVCAP